jgi:hypothetical protein
MDPRERFAADYSLFVPVIRNFRAHLTAERGAVGRDPAYPSG